MNLPNIKDARIRTNNKINYMEARNIKSDNDNTTDNNEQQEENNNESSSNEEVTIEN